MKAQCNANSSFKFNKFFKAESKEKSSLFKLKLLVEQ